MFLSNMFSVFLLGIQSKNVMYSRYIAAVVTSFGISIGNFLFAKFAANGGMMEFFVCAAGGCAGIASSIFFHDRFMRPKPIVAKCENDQEGYTPLPLGRITIGENFKTKPGLM